MSTAKRSPPFRAEHVGSLLRPDELVQKRYAVAAGKADAEELKPIEDKSVTEVVKLQKDCGFHAVSSGEYTRYVVSISHLHHNPRIQAISNRTQKNCHPKETTQRKKHFMRITNSMGQNQNTNL